jgi:anaerobic selenocysteine-containing dehydrogenase
VEATHHTNCVLCSQNCGLEITVADNRIVKVRPDRSNVRSEGYVCRKGLKVAHHQHHADRLTHPVKRVGGRFERISWDQAIDEIATRLKEIVDRHGPRSFAYMGGGGQGSHFEAAFGVRLLRGMGSQYHYTALGQEYAGMLWVHGRMFGRQYLKLIPDLPETDVLLVMGWNGMQSHGSHQAPRHLQRLAKDPNKCLIVVDPRRSETAKIADIHLAIRPGTDALLLRAMVAIVLQEGWENRHYLERHASGLANVAELFSSFDARAAIRTCHLDYERVREVCRLLGTRKSCIRYDLGLLMNRHSAVSSYLTVLLQALCGRIGVRGGSVFPGHIMPLGSHSDERDERTWRTVATGSFPVMGAYPPNVMPEEILSDHPQRLRAVYVSGSNPLRSYADTTAYETAFRRLDLLVTTELAMTETAVLSHYVLPARSGYESWDGTFFSVTFPELFFQMRRPIVEPDGEPLENGEILLRLADRLGLVPPIPDTLIDAAARSRAEFGRALGKYVQDNPAAAKTMPFVLGKTLGKALGSVHLAALWGLLQSAPGRSARTPRRSGSPRVPVSRTRSSQAILDRPEGLWISRIEPGHNLEHLHTEDGRIRLHVPELTAEIRELDTSLEEAALSPDPEFPLVLMAGRHMLANANTLMRDSAWLEGDHSCTVTMNPADAASLGLEGGQVVRVTTAAGSVEVELELTDTERKGHVTIPHGFGLFHRGRTYGVNVNRLTKNTHRDEFGTPLHRYVPCRVERARESTPCA